MELEELLGVLRSNLSGVQESELTRAAAEGLVEKLGPRVMLMRNDAAPGMSNGAPVMASLFDGAYGYLRVGRFGTGVENWTSCPWAFL